MKNIRPTIFLLAFVFLLSCKEKECLIQNSEFTACSTHNIILKNIATDENKTFYKIFKFNPQKPVMMDTAIARCENEIFAYGKTFKSDAEYESYEKELKKNSNHPDFNLLSEFNTSYNDVPIALELNDEYLNSQINENSFIFPNVIITITNRENNEKRIDSIILSVINSIPLKEVINCDYIQPNEKDVLLISSVHQSYTCKFSDNIIVLPDNSTNIRLMILPKDYKDKTSLNGYMLLCNIKICWNDGYLISKNFLLHFYE